MTSRRETQAGASDSELAELRRRVSQFERGDLELRQAEARFRGLLEAAPDAIIIADSNGRISLVNAQTEVLFGYGRDELTGQPIELLLPERLRSGHIEHRRRYQADPRTRPMGAGLDLLARCKDGSECPVEISLSPLKMDEGVLVISIVRDVTEQRRATHALRTQKTLLEEKIREMDDFTHVVSHDLKEPLRGIEAFAGFLLEDYGSQLDEQGKRYLTFLKQAAVRMKDLIHDLLALTALSRKEATVQPVDLNHVIAQVQRDLEFSIRQKGAEVKISLPLPTVACDAIRIGEVFKNLISNAIKFNTSTHALVDIACRDEGEALVFSIADNGIGIDPRYHERIFDLFERLNPQEQFEGTGAGLAICKKVIEAGGGRIRVESRPGQGSTFFFTIPKHGSVA
ncbi:MAG: ATP-binding protein [Nitrospiria bacterium]